jgi:TRAP-type C4-dicarboxylate transport system permease small subunit
MIRTIKNMLDRLLETVLMFSVGLLVLDVLWQVFTRKVLGNPSKWTEELAVFLLIWVALLGSAVALGRGAHLGIDYLTEKLPPKKRNITELVSFLVILLFSLYVMLYGGFDLVKSTLELGQISPAFGIKMGYVYLAVPVSGLFMSIYSFIGLIERVKAVSGGQVQ